MIVLLTVKGIKRNYIHNIIVKKINKIKNQYIYIYI